MRKRDLISVIKSIEKKECFLDKKGDLYAITDGIRVLIMPEDFVIKNDLLKYFTQNKRDIFSHIPVESGNCCRIFPSVEEIKFWIDKKKEEQRKDHRYGYRLFYYFEDSYCVNAEYLLDGMKATGEMFGYTLKTSTSVLFVSGNGILYGLCPIRSMEKRCGFEIIKI